LLMLLLLPRRSTGLRFEASMPERLNHDKQKWMEPPTGSATSINFTRLSPMVVDEIRKTGGSDGARTRDLRRDRQAGSFNDSSEVSTFNRWELPGNRREVETNSMPGDLSVHLALRGTSPKLSAAVSQLVRRGPLSHPETMILATKLAVTSRQMVGLRQQSRNVASVISRIIPRQRPRSRNRKASRDRRRMLGGSSALPDNLRHYYTEGQRSVLCIVAGEVKRQGICELAIDRVAALAGVCKTTVQTSMHEARRLGHIAITERPQRGRKSLTNVVRIVAADWLAWVKRAPSAPGLIGSNPVKMASTTKNINIDDAAEEEVSPDAIAFAKELTAIAGHEEGKEPRAWQAGNAPLVVQRMLKKLQDHSPILIKRPAVDILRSITVAVAKRRRAVGEPPQSPRYFQTAVNRMVDEWARPPRAWASQSASCGLAHARCEVPE
jgi:hypothetical protein